MKIFVLLVSIVSASCALAATPEANDVSARLYRLKCAGCHGPDGSGGIGATLKGKLRHASSAQLFEVIKNGIPGTQMPASGLPDIQVKNMVAYVLYLNKRKP